MNGQEMKNMSSLKNSRKHVGKAYIKKTIGCHHDTRFKNKLLKN